MKRYLIYMFAVAALPLAFASCSKFDDMNRNPYALETAPAQSYIQPIVFKTEFSLLNVYRNTTAHLMQHSVSTSTESTSRVVGNYAIPEATDDDIWTTLYIQYGNACSMYDTALTESNPTVTGIAAILKALVISLVTDTYGNVPFTEAGRIAGGREVGSIITRYDDQRDIYRGIVALLEEANGCFNDPAATDISPIFDQMYDGSRDKWQRFGNAIYLRMLMRISNKVVEESGGNFEYDPSTGESVNVRYKLAELYNCFVSGGGNYPMMRDIRDCALVTFNQYNSTLNTPFYSITSGNWNTVAACQTLARRMLDTVEKTDDDGQKYYEYKPVEKGGHAPDPRWDCYYRKNLGAPAQLKHVDFANFLAHHISKAGNSLVGRMPNGTAASSITQETYDLKNAGHYSLMNFSEQLFLFAEAGARGWIEAAASPGARLDLFKNAITSNILEWEPHNLTADSPQVQDFVNFKANSEKYSGLTFSGNPLEAILTEKWVSLFFIGIESWCDYRRTGYPILKTNGPAAENRGILPTRLRYPSDEAYRNVQYFREAVDGWLGGTNNMTTDLWWADTRESRDLRLLGRQ